LIQCIQKETIKFNFGGEVVLHWNQNTEYGFYVSVLKVKSREGISYCQCSQLSHIFES
jgi:hypothetical protein